MGKIAEAYVEVSAKTKAFDQGLDASRARLTAWAAGAQKLVAAFVITKVTHDFLAFMGSAAKSASDLAESTNKAQVAFGSAFPKMKRFAEEMAEQFGIVKTEIYDLTAGLGFMLTNAGLTRDVTADLAIQLAKAAMDVSSIQNMPVATVLEKIRAGLSGEAEPLRPLGVNLIEANVEKQARAMGATNKQLSDQEKLMARIALITTGLGYAQGDLAKTIGEYANATRRAQGDWENLKAEIGEKVKPVVLELVKAGYDLAASFKEAFGVSALESFAKTLESVKKMIGSLGEASPQTLAFFKDLDEHLGKWNKLSGEGKWDEATNAAFSIKSTPPKARSKAEGATGRGLLGDIWAGISQAAGHPGAYAGILADPEIARKFQAEADRRAGVNQRGPFNLAEREGGRRFRPGEMAGAAPAVKEAEEKTKKAAQAQRDAMDKLFRDAMAAKKFEQQTPARQKLADLQQRLGPLKDALGRAIQGPAGAVLGGLITGGVGGAALGAARSGLLNQLVPQGVGPIGSHVMGSAEFATFAQEQVSSNQNDAVEAAKKTQQNTKDTVDTLKEVGKGLKDVLSKLAARGAVLKGPA